MSIPAGQRKRLSKLRQYKALTGFWFKVTEVQAIGEELAQMEEAHGELSQLMIVEETKTPKCYPVLHSYIWKETDQEAAYRWRLQVAKQIVTHVIEVEVDDRTGNEVQLHPFIIVGDDDEADHAENKEPGHGAQRYMDRQKVDQVKYNEVRLAQAVNECMSFVRRFNDLEPLDRVVKEMRKILALHGKVV